MTESKIMKSYYDYMRSDEKLKVGTYEANQLAEICGIHVAVLVFLGARANAWQASIVLKKNWYIYKLEERILNGKTVYYITIYNSLNNI
jgi:hypothetical protein